jgi:outer membrane protein assembly factor BamE (lipoprotein component of BamABCDE complex)
MRGTAGIVAVALACGLVLTASCGPVVRTRGQMVQDHRLGEIVPGTTTAEEVLATLGSPSTTATFQDGVWYYIGQRMEQRAFFRPEVADRRVVQITFDADGVVEEVRELTLDDAREVELVERETPTLGRRMTVMEQLVGNLRRFGNVGGPGASGD